MAQLLSRRHDRAVAEDCGKSGARSLDLLHVAQLALDLGTRRRILG